MNYRATAAMVRGIGAAAALAAAAGGCARPCRSIETTPIDFTCEEGSQFQGELHLDDAAVFESFLSLECLPSSSPEQIAVLVGSVDFLSDVVFVAAGLRQVQSRCIESRDAATVAACDDGLRVGFDDRLSSAPACAGRWTVAFSLAREDLRAALGTDRAATGDVAEGL